MEYPLPMAMDSNPLLEKRARDWVTRLFCVSVRAMLCAQTLAADARRRRSAMVANGTDRGLIVSRPTIGTAVRQVNTSLKRPDRRSILNSMKGIILAGGHGTRLYPITQVMCKQLLPIYDKPMIYYPLSALMLAGIREVLIISTPEDLPRFRELLGDGHQLGMKFDCMEQSAPRGLAEAFILGDEFIGEDSVCMILGDNIFYGHALPDMLQEAASIVSGGCVFGYYVRDPQRYGVVEFNDDGNAVSIEEKPVAPRSNYAVVGIYFYDNQVVEIAKGLAPSGRGELEITDVNRIYLERGELQVKLMGRGFAWLDTGTHESLVDATQFVKTIEDRQGLKISCIEEIAYKMSYIDVTQLRELARPLEKSGYGEYLLQIAEGR